MFTRPWTDEDIGTLKRLKGQRRIRGRRFTVCIRLVTQRTSILQEENEVEEKETSRGGGKGLKRAGASSSDSSLGYQTGGGTS